MMAESVLCVNWKDHTSELATVYKSLLEKNFLVDCTLCAEGQSLKAHRLVLSACSPYFHKLFHEEETVKHPFVVFLEASFETLKAVIDFVYRGETHIPERNLKAFLTLAHSLHIKGLNAFTQDYNKISSNNPLENGPQGPSQDQFSEGESRSAAHDSPDNCQPDSHHVVGYPDAAHTDSSVPFEEHSPSYEEELFPREYQTPSGCDEVSIDTEITVKQEPLNSVCSERRNEKLDNVKSQKPISRNVAREINEGTISTYGEQDLNQYLSCGAPSLPPPQQQLVQLSVSEGVTEPSLPVIFVPKSEHMEDQESEEPMDDPFVSAMDKNSTEQTPAQRFIASKRSELSRSSERMSIAFHQAGFLGNLMWNLPRQNELTASPIDEGPPPFALRVSVCSFRSCDGFRRSASRRFRSRAAILLCSGNHQQRCQSARTASTCWCLHRSVAKIPRRRPPTKGPNPLPSQPIKHVLSPRLTDNDEIL